ncbi:MAG: trigger factor [Opitutales bacterium]|nr:trigger factor [Opitutales bacterium]
MKIETVSNTRKNVVVTIPASEILATSEGVTKRYVSQAKVPGFRPGKAPATLVAKNFAKSIAEETESAIVSKAYNECLKELEKDESCKLYGVIDLKKSEIKTDADADLTFVCEVVPAFALPEYKGIELKAESTDVSDEDVSATVDRIRSQHAEFNKVETPAAKGDFVKVSYVGTIDGAAFPESVAIYGKQSSTWEEAGSEEGYGATIKEISMAVVGMKEGDKKTVELKFADDFPKDELKGKNAVYEVEVLEVRQRKLPEMNEDFFKMMHVADEAELRKQVAEGMKSNKERQAQAAMRQEAVLKISGMVDFELPETALERATQDIFAEFVNQQMQMGMKADDLLAKREEVQGEAKEAAKTRVKAQILLGAIADAEKVEVTQQELAQEVARQAYASGQKPEKLVKELSKDRSRLAEIRESVRCSKALALIVDAAKKI